MNLAKACKIKKIMLITLQLIFYYQVRRYRVTFFFSRKKENK